MAASYTAKNLSVLEGLDAVRKRPGMYIGSTDARGLMHCIWEIIDNSVDEALAGFCTEIDIILHPDGSLEVRDNGRGIPVDVESRTKLTGVEVVLTKLHAGGKFGGGSYGASGGLHGVGASVVNALSSRLDVEVDRDSKIYRMSFRRGVPGIFDAEGPDSSFSKKSGLRIDGKVPKKVTGTRIRWWFDQQIFLKDAAVSLSELHDRARQTSFLVPGLKLVVKDQRDKATASEEVFQHKGGISEYCSFLASGGRNDADADQMDVDHVLSDVIRISGGGSFKETVPVLDDKGHMTSTEVERDVHVDVALHWGGGYDTQIRSFVNIIATPKGGTHVVGFERSLTKTLNDAVKTARLLKSGDEDLAKDDVQEGLTAVVTVRLAEPQFEGQTKEVLGTSAVSRIVANVMAQEFGGFLTSSRRVDKARAKIILEKVVAAARTRVAARQHKELQRRKTALESSSLPTKLADCRTDDVERSELFIVEGDSALGTAKLARSSEFQALLPIRGKILNVHKASVGDMLKNAECAAIIQVLGAGSGRSFELEQVRYGKIILMSDADVDGAHIRCLLLTLFHRYMPELLNAGRIYAAVPPLHRIEVVNGGGKKNEYVYTYSDQEMRKVIADLAKKNKRYKEPIQRYKGLGEMDAIQLRETTMDPSKRSLRRVTMKDVQAATEVFELLMGSDVGPRKEFIVEAEGLAQARIDA
ncbi:unannotated protein [freshwater metagenome]|uniref:DNA topoisomerase (ATP-hydrolyzing) n=1 Tax=freshwater metagenome TaxID=449393 RepID=A0A6J7CWM4_9ZZZZ|nr:DNA gyrase subunit B [Actinomycetota bacterium]